MAQPVLAVRSKIGSLGAARGDGSGGVKGGIAGTGGVDGGGARRWVLEAQLENVGGEGIVVERCCLKGGEGVLWRGGIGGQDGEGEWDGSGKGGEIRGGGARSVVLRPRDVYQVMFVVEDREASGVAAGGAPKALAQVDIDWRSSMGEKGRLTTGWLAARG